MSALEPYAELLDIVLIMTVEPGFGGQAFMKEVLAAKAAGAREILKHKLYGGEIHVDGGIDRETAEFAGSHGADVFVAGSAPSLKAGTWVARSASSGRSPTRDSSTDRMTGRAPIPSDRMTRFTSLPKHLAHRLMDEIEATGIPVMMLRGEGEVNPDGVRDYDLLVPATVEEHVIDAHGPTRDRLLAEAQAWRRSFTART